MFIGGMGECLPYPDNRVTLGSGCDDWGRRQIAIDFSWHDNEREMARDMAAEAAAMLEAAGGTDIVVSDAMGPGGRAIHEMGTARMGDDPALSVLNAHNQCHDAANVFVTDGACMPASAAQNPSLTYMALTARAAAYAADQIKEWPFVMQLPVMSRRGVLGAGFGSLLLASCKTANLASAPQRELGIQLYTLMDLLDADMDGTLAAVSQVGYRQVETLGSFGLDPVEFRAMLRSARSGHRVAAYHAAGPIRGVQCRCGWTDRP